MNARGRQRDWAGLVPELVYTIAREVTDISDFIRFRAVCKKWRSATTIADMSPQFPWLLNETTGPDLHFYSIALKKSFTFHVPKISDDEYVVNPCHGLMLVKSSSSKLSWWLLNPLNNNVVSLPSMREFSWELIGSPGYQSRDYVVVEGCKHLNVVKPGDDKWIKLEKKDSDFYFYFKNLLFIFDVFSWFTKVIDLCTHETVFVVPPPPKKFQFCDFGPTPIESYGEVLLVNYLLGSKKIVIQQLEYDGNGQGNLHWVEPGRIYHRGGWG
ncbi:F-box domain-containing protein [Rhynchospora pubera]|uniref:F-box domain-containing protein n=1 Tax=Rhynchospora pubera TaxID=906938 RepID=A0AAV8F804_9POAL|nr:F-box domain-containing protein [Rhynchospora pubera]